MAVQLDAENEAEAWLLGNAGYGLNPLGWDNYIFVFPIEREGKATTDPFKQDCYELRIAHQYINENFDELDPGAVIDTEFVQGHTAEPVKSDRFYVGRV
jgi:hypothetical protein